MTDQLAATIDDRVLGNYLAALSSGFPTPGGGSAAGVAGALGCALGSMVCNLTLAREPNEQIDELRLALLELQSAMLRQAEADERVFGAYREAMDLPRSTPEEKAHRRAAIENTLVAAADVPGQMVILGLSALIALRGAAVNGSPHALGDLLTGGYLVGAMIQGALENMTANAARMKIASNRERFEEAAQSGAADFAAEMQALQAAVAARTA
ncbi:MAG: cyclodeaminase/cyclohydrolase family protein [Thermomicrobiales bacterium]|nr:cyclodeaminase/cyclohydrolase family protein [Thermomicrobiales bacterium]